MSRGEGLREIRASLKRCTTLDDVSSAVMSLDKKWVKVRYQNVYMKPKDWPRVVRAVRKTTLRIDPLHYSRP